MKTEHWIAIVVPVIISLGQLLNMFFKDWRERHRAHQRPQQPGYRIRYTIDWLAKLHLSLVLSIFGMSSSVFFLMLELSSQDPVGHGTLFDIALFAGTILYYTLFLTLRKVINRIDNLVNVVDKTVIIQDHHRGQIKRMLRILEAQQGADKKGFDQA